MSSLYRPGRLRAFQALFEAEFGLISAQTALDRRQAEEPLSAADRRFAEAIVAGVIQRRTELDARIQEAAPAWPVDQLPTVDRTVLRLALFELLFNNAAVPAGAVINEAVELAKTYGSDASRRFVNGVLGTISRQRRPEASPTEPETEEPREPV